MSAQTDILWRVNNQYRKRLAQAQTYLNLVQYLISSYAVDDDPHLLHILQLIDYASQQIEDFINDHRAWRADYYFAETETRRMVQQDQAVYRALAHFEDMRQSHETPIHELLTILAETPRPDPAMTTTPGGDLWLLVQTALEDLAQFDAHVINGKGT